MAKEATARVLAEEKTPLRVIPGYGGGPPPTRRPIVANAHLGMAVVLAATAMLFFGLIGAYLVFRYGSTTWPPPGLPRLPLFVTWINTVVLLTSGLAMQGARVAVRRDDTRALVSRLRLTAALGATFLLIQGSEWVRLIHHGLKLSSSTYGATFYTLVGLHGLHVFGAVVALVLVARRARAGRFSSSSHVGIDLTQMYWTFVLALWVLLFIVLYLR